MNSFRLYRIQIFQPQNEMFHSIQSGSEILQKVLAQKLVKSLKTRKYYAVGFERVDANSVYFKFARSRLVKTIEFENDKPKEISHEDNPFIEVFIDHHLEICALSKNGKFSATSEIGAKKLEELLQASGIIKKYKCEVHLDPIKDPRDFISHIERASIISKFYFEVRRPNVLDSQQFIQPLKALNQKANSKFSKTELSGGLLDKDVVKSLAQTVASTGDDAGAWIKLPHIKSFVFKSLGKSHVDFEWNKDIQQSLREIVNKVRDLYKRVRHDN